MPVMGSSPLLVRRVREIFLLISLVSLSNHSPSRVGDEAVHLRISGSVHSFEREGIVYNDSCEKAPHTQDETRCFPFLHVHQLSTQVIHLSQHLIYTVFIFTEDSAGCLHFQARTSAEARRQDNQRMTAQIFLRRGSVRKVLTSLQMSSTAFTISGSWSLASATILSTSSLDICRALKSKFLRCSVVLVT
mmetsp:Transcript_6406/g.23736  ORF Transcript_6406/g.23736 Transcript_6406/m.23736 type:complete len:190 (+) Transcript_6406:240-809(+)